MKKDSRRIYKKKREKCVCVCVCEEEKKEGSWREQLERRCTEYIYGHPTMT